MALTCLRVGVSYMLAPVMRTLGPADLQVRTMAIDLCRWRTVLCLASMAH